MLFEYLLKRFCYFVTNNTIMHRTKVDIFVKVHNVGQCTQNNFYRPFFLFTACISYLWGSHLYTIAPDMLCEFNRYV